ncbi:MAG: NEW3 domain-containing protein [Rikenellaceae bacterium]|nr:NEW3 domain-containing protein [Rikenellaceae bacterium]
MKPVNLLKLCCLTLLCSLTAFTYAQDENQASLLLDLRKSRASYEVALQKYQNDTKLFQEQAISANDYNSSRNELLSREVDYQKLILRLISQQSYITVERAIKYQDERGNRKVKITLKSALEGNEEYLQQFEDHFDIFIPEMRSGKIYNIYLSLIDNGTKTIISAPYEFHVPSMELGKVAQADFELLKDAEYLTVSLNYNNRKDEKNIYLQKDASSSQIDISSMQFSQETNLGSNTTYELNLERFSTTDDIYRLQVTGLPPQISYDFTDIGSKVTQIKFAQGVNMKKLSLQIYLPDREDEAIVIDEPIKFQVEVLHGATGETAGSEQLEIIPRGRGRIEVRANNLYHEVTMGNDVKMEMRVRNGGSRRLDNIKVTAEKPLGWDVVIEPELIRSLDPEKEEVVTVTVLPPTKGVVGAQEVRIKTEAMAYNVKVETEDKVVRIQVKAAKSVLGIIVLIAALLGVLLGIVWFGMKLSRK